LYRSTAIAISLSLILLFVDRQATAAGPEATDNLELTTAFNDAWYNPDTAGQGFFITVLPKSNLAVLSYFTWDTEEAAGLGEAHLGDSAQRWLLAIGPISGHASSMKITMARGGLFDHPQSVTEYGDGTITLVFDGCNSGTIDYDITSINRTGRIPITRVSSANVPACEAQLAAAASAPMADDDPAGSVLLAEAGDSPGFDTAFNDAWYFADTAGQGFFITALPGINLAVLSYFTWDTDEATGLGGAQLGDPAQRWMLAIGPIDGYSSTMNVTTVSGGLFDNPKGVVETNDGTIVLNFTDCNTGTVEYDLKSIDRRGTIPITRVAPDNVESCEQARDRSEPWKYWTHNDVRVLDGWGEQPDTHSDLVAIYQKETPGQLDFRLDFMDLTSSTPAKTYFGLDFASGGVSTLANGQDSPKLDIDWDLLIEIDGGSIRVLDTGFNPVDGVLTDVVVDRHLDYVAFRLDRSAMAGWDGGVFSMQALTTGDGPGAELDRTVVADTDDVTGRGKLVIHLNTAAAMHAPFEIWDWDGYVTRPDERPGERHGYRYVFDAAEEYGIPISISDVRTDTLPGWEFFGITGQFRRMHDKGLLQLSSSTTYGQFMTWWPDSVNQKAIDLTLDIKKQMDIPSSELFYPYESMVRTRDIELIRQNGYSAIYVCGWYPYWLDAHTTDFSDWTTNNAHVRTTRKINRVNGMNIIFDPQAYAGGVVRDIRWPSGEAANWSWSWLTRGNDHGLHHWYRRSLLDLALDGDQQQFTAAGGDDIAFTDWQFKDVADYNFEWLASHPWIEVTTYEDILGRGWDVVDHGYLDIEPDEHLRRFPMQGDLGSYNSYFEQHYYGGPSDGHAASVPEGVEIEGLYDFLPFLRDGQPIPSGRIFGDYKTPGTLAYETIANLESAPDNALTDLAWLTFLHHTCEITFHDKEKLTTVAKARATHLPQSNKIVEAARWAQAAGEGQYSGATVTRQADLDLDGENEYIIHNDRVFAILENDGGRVEYAFAWSAATGAVQLVAPLTQVSAPYGGDEIVQAGEVAMLINQGSDLSVFRDFYASNFEGFFDVMSVEVREKALVFGSPDGTITKTFTLDGDTLTATYDLDGNEAINTDFCFVTNMRGRFERDWNDKFAFIDDEDKVGWQSANGGYAVVNRLQPWPIGPGSSLDSPTKDEPWQYENNEGYDWGHWLHLPYSCATVNYNAKDATYDISITLRAESDIME